LESNLRNTENMSNQSQQRDMICNTLCFYQPLVSLERDCPKANDKQNQAAQNDTDVLRGKLEPYINWISL